MTGFYELDKDGRLRIRTTLGYSTIKRFLNEVKQNDFDDLLAFLGNIPAGNFYSYKNTLAKP